MAQPSVMSSNGVHDVEATEAVPPVAPGKRKRDAADEGDDVEGDEDIKPSVDTDMSDAKPPTPMRNQRELVGSCFAALRSFDIEPPILKRPLPEVTPDEEPDTKRQKSTEPPSARSISDKVAASTYERLSEMMADVKTAVKATLNEMEAASSSEETTAEQTSANLSSTDILDFKKKAMDLLRRENAYPQLPSQKRVDDEDEEDALEKSRVVLSLVGQAPQERRLFSSLQVSDKIDLSEHNLPAGVTMTRVMPSNPQETTMTLGEVFAPPRALPALQPPKQPKTQAKGNQLDFYHPELTDKSQYRSNSFFSAKLSAGHFLDYSNATPALPAKAKQHERAQSLAGKKPSSSELEMSEMDALFRGAFSSFAPCKDDSSAVVPSNIAGRMWWQRAGHGNFQNLIEVEYYDQLDGENSNNTEPVDIDESALQKAIDSWDEGVVDPTLEDVMGTKRDESEKEADEILDEVSDMIETLASYQRIRNLNLPNSQNRQSSDPVTGDMLANSGPQPTEEEQATYQMLKAQLALIIKTLPPYVVSKLNGDQLEDLLISTKIEVATDQYKGVMEEDDAAVQARLRAQQQQAAQVNARAQRTPSISYSNQYHSPNQQYGTPTRPSSQSQQPFYRHGVNQQFQPQYQQQRQFLQSAQQQRPPQPNQYSRPNGYPNQYATQLAKAQTPYGHQNMQYANQQQQFRHTPQQNTPATRYQHYQGPNYQHQQAGTPTQGSFGAFTNGSGMHQQQQQQQQQQRMSPQVPQRQAYSSSPNLQQNQRYGTPKQGMGGQVNRFQSTPSHGSGQPNALGWNTFIPEAQQQRILEQAKARVAAQERSAQHNHDLKGSISTGVAGLAGIGLGGNVDVSRLAAQRASMGGQQKPSTPTPGQRPGANGNYGSAHVPPQKVTPVPVPVFPGQQPQQQPQRPPSQQ